MIHVLVLMLFWLNDHQNMTLIIPCCYACFSNNILLLVVMYNVGLFHIIMLHVYAWWFHLECYFCSIIICSMVLLFDFNLHGITKVLLEFFFWV